MKNTFVSVFSLQMERKCLRVEKEKLEVVDNSAGKRVKCKTCPTMCSQSKTDIKQDDNFVISAVLTAGKRVCVESVMAIFLFRGRMK